MKTSEIAAICPFLPVEPCGKSTLAYQFKACKVLVGMAAPL
jgi:hypothetical protein